MAKDNFELKKMNDEEIVLEEKKKRRKGILFFFFGYGSILGTSLMFLSIVIFFVGLGFSISELVDNSKKRYDIEITSTVEYEHGSNLEIININPMTDEDGMKMYTENDDIQSSKLKITNKSLDAVASYIVAITDMTYGKEDGLDSRLIRYNILENGASSKIFNLRNETNILNGALESGETFPKNTYIITEGILKPGEIIDYELMLWLSQDADNSQMNKTFEGKLQVYFEYKK